MNRATMQAGVIPATLTGFILLSCASNVGAASSPSAPAASSAQQQEALTIEPEVSGAPGDPLRARFVRLTERELKNVYLWCSQEAERRRLDGCEVVRCSVGRDVMMQRDFGGDFDALLAWAQTQLNGPDGPVSVCAD